MVQRRSPDGCWTIAMGNADVLLATGQEEGHPTVFHIKGKQGTYGALLTSSGVAAVPQAIEVKGQAEQHRLANLHRQAATGSFRREFAFDHREDRFHFRPWRVQFLRERAVHLIADGSFRNAASGVGRDYALCSERAADMSVIGFG